MPELPDLTVFAESLQRSVLNRKIVEVVYHHNGKLNLAPDRLREALIGAEFETVGRVGKELLFTLNSGRKFLVHLMLAGGFRLARQGERVSSSVLTVAFDDGGALVLFDPKGLTKITFDPDLGAFATDALEVTAELLQAIFKKKPRSNVKAALIDQSLIAGIGNAYIDEILWEARIAPGSMAGKIPQDAVVKLAESTRRVLESATAHLRENHSGMLAGEVRDFLAVHNPKAVVSPTGHKIIKEQIASKKTYYTDEQVLYS